MQNFASKPKVVSSSTRLKLYFSKFDLFKAILKNFFKCQMKYEVYAVAHVKIQVNWLSNRKGPKKIMLYSIGISRPDFPGY